MRPSKHNQSIYLTATLAILPVLLMLGGCRKSPQPTTPIRATSSLSAITATPTTYHATQAQPPNLRPGTVTPCTDNQCSTPSLSSTISPTPFSSLGVDPDDLRGLKLQFWYIAQAGDAVGLLPAFVLEFNRSNPWGILVEITAFESPGLLSEQVRSTLYSGKLPDVLAGYSYQVTSWDKNDNTLVDLNVYLDDHMWGLPAEEQADLFPAIWQQVNPAKRLSFPLHRTAVGLYYNSTWAQELGFAASPQTPDDFERQACAAAIRNGDGTGGWLITPDTSTLVAWMYAFGGSLVKPDNKGYQIDTPENYQALMFLKNLQTKGCVWTTTQLYPHSEFAERKALFMMGSTTGLAGQNAAFQSIETHDEWTVIPFPAKTGTSTPRPSPVLILHGQDLMIPRTTPERQLAAWLFARWMTSSEVQSRWVRADGSCALRGATVELLGDYAQTHPQWASMVSVLDNARSEPAFASWEIVRWVMSDAAAQLFSSTFGVEGVSELLTMLEQTAAEAHVQVR